MASTKTFQQLEGPDYQQGTGDSPLDDWYRGLRNVPIGDLEDGDLARACRQQLYLDHVVPTAAARLNDNPLAGGGYAGELLVAMKSIPTAY